MTEALKQLIAQQAEEYANKNFVSLFDKVKVKAAYLAAATKYISEIEARDKKIQELVVAMSDINANLILGNTKAAFEKTYEILTAFHPSKDNKKGE